jgi:choice-of-anchor C domain-containing protein
VLAAGDNSGTVRMWNVVTGEQLHSWRAHSTIVSRLAFSSDGRRLASGSRDTQVTVWDVATAGRLRRLKGHSGTITALAFSTDGRSLVTGDGEGTAHQWDLDAAPEARTLVDEGGYLGSLAFSSDGRWLATGNDNGTARLWEVSSGRVRHVLSGHRPTSGPADQPNRVYRLAFAPDGKTLATGGIDSIIRLWDVATGRQVRLLEGLPVSFLPTYGRTVGGLAFSPDGKCLAAGFGMPSFRTADYGAVIKLWDTASGRAIRTLPGHLNTVVSLAFSPDNRTLASGSQDGTVRLWNLRTGEEILRFATADIIWSHWVSFSPDGKTLAVGGGGDGTIHLYDPTSGREKHTLRGHSGSVHGLSFSRDGRTLASAADDGSVKLWDLATGRETRTMQGHLDRVECVAFSPDGNTLASGSRDGTLRLWEAAPPREIAAALAAERAMEAQRGALERDVIAQAASRNTRGSGAAGLLVKGNLVANGSFERGPDLGAFANLAEASTKMRDWTVSRGSVDLIGLDRRAAHGRRWVDLNGASPGGIRQSFSTVPGRRYRVTFDLAGQPAGTALKRLRVAAAGESADFEFDITGRNPANMGWVSKSWQFTADSTVTELEIYALSPGGPNGPAVDNVAVVPVARQSAARPASRR